MSHSHNLFKIRGTFFYTGSYARREVQEPISIYRFGSSLSYLNEFSQEEDSFLNDTLRANTNDCANVFFYLCSIKQFVRIDEFHFFN